MQNTTIKVWDLPTRLFHWSLVMLVAAAWASAEFEKLALHMLIGQGILALLIFRVLWGFVGSETARFSHFLQGKSAIFGYMKTLGTRGGTPHIGHNPLGALSVLAMLAFLLVQVATGLFSSAEILDEGPLAHLVGYETSRAIAGIHEGNFSIVLTLIGLHIAAIAFYLRWKRQNLVRPMIVGYVDVNESDFIKEPHQAAMKKAFLCATLAVITSFAIGVL